MTIPAIGDKFVRHTGSVPVTVLRVVVHYEYPDGTMARENLDGFLATTDPLEGA